MKKQSVLACILAFLLMVPVLGTAQGVTLSTTSNLFGEENTAQLYMDTLVAWEQATGNTIEDYSGLPEDLWKDEVLRGLGEGRYDVIYYYAASTDSAAILDSVVPMEEVRAAYPNAKLGGSALLAEPDGKVYAVPVRGTWLGLFCNTDLFEMYGLQLPTDWDAFEAAIAKFHAEGILPISASLSDMPHHLVELAILASGSPEDHRARPQSADAMPVSWVTGMQLIRKLYEMGAFATDVNATTEVDASTKFREKEAAMQIDGLWFANSIPEELWDSTVMLPFPAYNPGAEAVASVGDVAMGFYITRSAWNDPARREAAVSLLEALTADEKAAQFGFAFGGALRDSAQEMSRSLQTLCDPIGDAMQPEARERWFSQIPGIADGSLDPTQTMREIVDGGAFAQ